MTYANKSFPGDYIPTVGSYGGEEVQLSVDGKPYVLRLWDTLGQSDYDNLRPLCYPQTDVFLLCFDLNKLSSFQSVKDKWYPELKYHCPNTSIVLVGTKLDLKDDRNVTHDQGLQMQHDIKATTYVECSAQIQMNVDAVFEEAVRASLLNPPRTSEHKKCTVM